jgi:hypothetical protein
MGAQETSAVERRFPAVRGEVDRRVGHAVLRERSLAPAVGHAMIPSSGGPEWRALRASRADGSHGQVSAGEHGPDAVRVRGPLRGLRGGRGPDDADERL